MEISLYDHELNKIEKNYENINEISKKIMVVDDVKDCFDKIIEITKKEELMYSSINEGIHFKNGLVHSVIQAYNQHHNLVLRPDDFLIAFQVNLSNYINANAEKLRKTFVDHEGKKEIRVEFPSLSEHNWLEFVEIVYEELNKNIKMNLKDVWTCNFSTSTEKDKLISNMTLMSSMKSYFDYAFQLSCGIPKLIILGKRSDWHKLYSKIYYFLKLEEKPLNKWICLILEVIEKILNYFDGKEDKEFMKNICKYTNPGSGTPYIDGWITLFTAIDENGKFIDDSDSFYIKQIKKYQTVKTSNILSGSVIVPVKVYDINGDFMFDVNIYGGHLIAKKYDDFTYQPALDWMIVKVKE